jgi:putative transposase
MTGLQSIGGVCRRLRKWDIKRKWGRLHITSPDPEYQHKLAQVQQARQAAREEPEQVSVLYADEFTFYRQPCLGRVYHAQGQRQPTAPYLARANTKRRIVSALDVATGQVSSRTGSVIGVQELCRFVAQLRQRYGSERRLVLIWDNWPIHKHARVEQAAREQRVEVLYVPTYAPWTNPIEKFWNKLKDKTLRMHRLSEAWERLKSLVEAFLEEHDAPRPDLLRQVGLEPNRLPI